MELIKLGEALYVPQDFETHHHYYADPEGTKEYTGVTTLLNKVIAKPALIQWAANEAVKYIEANQSKFWEEVREMFHFDPIKFNEVLKEARTAHARFRDKRAEEGTDLHALAEEYIKHCLATTNGSPMPAGTGNAAIQKFAVWAGKEKIRFIASEAKLYSPKLFVAGTADFIFEKEGKLYVGDIKNKKKIYGREPFFQCAGYSIMREEMTGEQFAGYCVVRLWEEELEALWSVDTEGDMEGFLACARLYRLLAQNNVVTK